MFAAQVVLYICFSVTFFFTVLAWTNTPGPFPNMDHADLEYNGVEKYDPSLARLNSIDKLIAYCDSNFNAAKIANPDLQFTEGYPQIASQAVRARFYHGFSSYKMQDNYSAVLFEKFSDKWLSAIVVPDDIMKHPSAACSQQSIVMMELLERKGYPTRKVAFNSQESQGHFAFEVKYDGEWHFFDPNLEPDLAVLAPMGMPSIQALMAETDKKTIRAAYHNQPVDLVLAIFDKYAYGKVNTFPAPRAIIYQRATKIFSNVGWAFFLIAFILIRRRYLQLVRNPIHVRHYRVYFPKISGRRSPAYYPEYSA